MKSAEWNHLELRPPFHYHSAPLSSSIIPFPADSAGLIDVIAGSGRAFVDFRMLTSPGGSWHALRTEHFPK